MLEEIIKEVQNKSFIPDSYCEEHISLEDLFKILDKYKDKEIKFEDGNSKFSIVKVPKLDVDNIKNYNQPDYKSAWNELKNKTNEELEQATWASAGLNDTKISIEELEQKYKLGGE